MVKFYFHRKNWSKILFQKSQTQSLNEYRQIYLRENKFQTDVKSYPHGHIFNDEMDTNCVCKSLSGFAYRIGTFLKLKSRKFRPWILYDGTYKSLMVIVCVFVILFLTMNIRFARNYGWFHCKAILNRKVRRTLNRLPIDFDESNL